MVWGEIYDINHAKVSDHCLLEVVLFIILVGIYLEHCGFSLDVEYPF